MKDEGIEMSLVTHSIIVDGFAKLGNIEAAERWFKVVDDRIVFNWADSGTDVCSYWGLGLGVLILMVIIC